MKINNTKLDKNASFKLIHIQTSHNKNFFSQHRHEFYELIFITQGYGQHSIDFTEYDLVPKKIYLIPPAKIHKWLLNEFQNEYDGYIFQFSKELFLNDVMVPELFHKSQKPYIYINKDIENKLQKLVSWMEEEDAKKDIRLTADLFTVFLRYLLHVKKEYLETNRENQRLEHIDYLIEKHYTSEKRTLFYAQQLDLSVKRLNEIIQKEYAQTFTSYLNQRIITEAKRELIFSQASVKQISENLGYFDASYFSRFFKKHTDQSALEFRASNQ